MENFSFDRFCQIHVWQNSKIESTLFSQFQIKKNLLIFFLFFSVFFMSYLIASAIFRSLTQNQPTFLFVVVPNFSAPCSPLSWLMILKVRILMRNSKISNFRIFTVVTANKDTYCLICFEKPMITPNKVIRNSASLAFFLEFFFLNFGVALFEVTTVLKLTVYHDMMDSPLRWRRNNWTSHEHFGTHNGQGLQSKLRTPLQLEQSLVNEVASERSLVYTHPKYSQYGV